MINFMLQFGSLVVEINRLLKIKFMPSRPSNATPIGRLLIKILESHNKGDYQDRDLQLARLTIFVKNLKEIEAKKPQLINHFRKEIKKAGSTDNFFGVRFEINIAASLIRKNIDFTKQESPDFAFVFNSESLALECSSVRIRSEKDTSDYNYKISSCINKKESSGYHDNKTALFIDTTNLYYQTLSKDGVPDVNAMRSTARESMSKDSFGNITLFSFFFDIGKKQYQSNYARIDHDLIDKNLKNFMDTFFPFGSHKVDKYYVALEG